MIWGTSKPLDGAWRLLRGWTFGPESLLPPHGAQELDSMIYQDSYPVSSTQWNLRYSHVRSEHLSFAGSEVGRLGLIRMKHNVWLVLSIELGTW